MWFDYTISTRSIHYREREHGNTRQFHQRSGRTLCEAHLDRTILLAIPILFLAFDGIGKVLQPVEVVEGTLRLGYAVKSIIVIGLLELGSLLLFCIPRTSILGALFLTAFLGGAVATHIRIGDPLFSHILFPTYIAILLWSGLLMLDLRLRTLLPFRSPLTDHHR